MKIRKQRTTERTLKVVIDDKKRRLEMLTENFRAICITIRNNQKVDSDSLLITLKELRTEFNRQNTFIKEKEKRIDRENLFGISAFQDYEYFYSYKLFFDDQFSIVRSNLNYIQYLIPYEGEYKDLLEYFAVY